MSARAGAAGPDGALEARVRRLLGGRAAEKRMFGGLCFLLGGHICCSVSNRGLLVRTTAAVRDELLAMPNVRPMTMGGRVMAGYLYVEPEGVLTDEELAAWIERSREIVDSLPPNRSHVRKKPPG